MEIEQKPTAPAGGAAVIGPEQLKNFLKVLEEYKSGKTRTEMRIVASERWWKLRNSEEEEKETNIGKDGGYKSVSGWLHNVLVSKHADAMEAYPEPNILPRESGDRGEARMLSSIIPCILEQNHFEHTYSDVMWQKVKTGTGVYKVVWDKSKLNGLGDIGVERVNLLNIYWEPGVTDIQRSRYFFHTEMYDKDVLEQKYPELEGKLKGQSFVSTKFLYDDHVNTENKHTVIDVYYHKYVQGKKTVQYCKFVGDVVLYATENDTERPKRQAVDPMGRPILVDAGLSPAERGLYDHGNYPYVFDALFPIEGSPCGYGYVDLCRNPQTTIDLLNTSFVKNAMVGAIPRYFSRGEGSINEKEFLDLSKPIVHSASGVDDNALRPIEHKSLDGVYVNVLDRTIQELRETSGNTETSTGSISSGVTAASAIAALQQASGKGSRDSTQAAYRAYSEIVNLCIELIRQFYDMPRQFRILGQYGAEEYITYVNQGLQLQSQGASFDDKENFRLPVFDIKVSAQKKNVYTKVTQNELALQFFQLGFFNPQMTDQALMCLDMMEFDGKDGIMQKVSQNGTMFQKLLQYMQLALTFAQQLDPMAAETIAQDILMTTGGGGVPASGGAGLAQSRAMTGDRGGAETKMNNARAASAEASQPSGGRVTGKAGEK
jgi:hypothetical protein